VAAARLPVATSALIGRSDEVVAVLGLLSDGITRLVTLTGPPGVGKTRLALEVAARSAGRFADGVAWVDVGTLHDCRQVPGELARGLGLDAADGTRSAGSAVTAFDDREMLLVVDNYEHLLGAASAVGDLLDLLPGLRVLATSRQRLHLLAEAEYPVPPLPSPGGAEIDDVAAVAGYPAVQLLLARAPAHVTLNRRTARPLVDICLRLDGLPLALELAAARLRVFTPGELSFRLEHRTVQLTGGPTDAPGRHRTLTAAIAWSHELLPDAQRTVLRRLSVLDGEWDMAAAQAVCGLPAAVTLAAVESLLDHSLLRRVPAEGSARFAMLTSIRDFAAEQLAAKDEPAETRARHAAHFAEVAAAWEASVGTDGENAAWADLDAVHPDLAAAFEQTLPGRTRAWLGVVLAWHAHLHGTLAHVDTLLDALHEIADLPTDDLSPSGLDTGARVAVLTAAGVLGISQGALARAEQDLRTAVTLSRDAGDERRQAFAMSFLGHVARSLGHAAEAAQHYRAARVIGERRGNVRGTAWAAYDLGLLAVEEHDAVDGALAEPLLREALTYFEDLDYDWAVAESARGLATVLLARGAVDEAGRLLGRSLVLHERVGDRRGRAQCLEALAEVAATRGSAAGAARLIGASEAQRTLSGTTPNAHELHRLHGIDTTIVSTLGRAAVDHEKHNGRTAPRSALLALAADVAQPPVQTDQTVALTGRQTQVAALVARGDTNRQIGRALGISEKTAEIHVSNILARLNVPSRAGVAAWVAARSRPEPPP
jgi:predicted ATPase/DNA-binding CsgD family transcriptional regulator